jgi:hypothetical protein
MKSKIAPTAVIVAGVGMLSFFAAALVKGQAQDKIPEATVCRHGALSGGTPWDADSALRKYRSFVSESGKAFSKIESPTRSRISIDAQRFEGCARNQTRIQKLPASGAHFSGEIVFASTRSADALKGRIGAQTMVVFVDFDRIEDVLAAVRELGCRVWSLGSKDAAQALGVTCVPSVLTSAGKRGEVRIDEINLR